MNDQPKPATGEWTVEWLRQYLSGYSSYDLQLKAIADAHNAALAAAQNLRIEAKQNWKLIDQLRKQLAAEQEIRK